MSTTNTQLYAHLNQLHNIISIFGEKYGKLFYYLSDKKELTVFMCL